MDLYPALKALAVKVEQLKDKIETEEHTKHAFVLPLIQILGYDAFNPLEVVPEFTADLGIKKGEKVDYAIYLNGDPVLIIECKDWRQKLDPHNSQLFRYFHVTKTRFALLTNGIEYRFYTDLEAPNKMDETAFFVFKLDELKESIAKEVEKFHKSNFDVEKIVNNASTLKYTREIKNVISKEISEPSQELVRHFAHTVYKGRLTSAVLEEFKEIVSKAFGQLVSERVNERLSTALSKEKEVQKGDEVEEKIVEKITTSDEEMEAFRIVQAIARKRVPKDRVKMRDTQSYCGILLDDNNRKPICRLHLNSDTHKYLTVFGDNRVEEKIRIESVDDIYEHSDKIIGAIENYEK